LLQPAADRLAEFLAVVPYGPFALPVISNVTAKPHTSPQAVKDLLIAQVCAPVRWEESMQYAVAQGCEAFLEVGPGKVLTGMMRRIAPQVEILSVDEMLAR
jgi:[acyl-carrier-protein] S-malonyltransferase